jgi:hypothetical protein
MVGCRSRRNCAVHNAAYGGILLLSFGVLIAGMTTLIAVLAARKAGPIIWHRAIVLLPLGVFWVGSTAMTIAGIYLLSGS